MGYKSNNEQEENNGVNKPLQRGNPACWKSWEPHNKADGLVYGDVSNQFAGFKTNG